MTNNSQDCKDTIILDAFTPEELYNALVKKISRLKPFVAPPVNENAQRSATFAHMEIPERRSSVAPDSKLAPKWIDNKLSFLTASMIRAAKGNPLVPQKIIFDLIRTSGVMANKGEFVKYLVNKKILGEKRFGSKFRAPGINWRPEMGLVEFSHESKRGANGLSYVSKFNLASEEIRSAVRGFCIMQLMDR